MPFVSKAQQVYLCATNKKLCEEFAKKTPKSVYPTLPEHVSNEKKRSKK